MHLYPSRVILGSWGFSKAYCFYPSLVVYLLVAPYSVCPHIRAVKIGFGGVEDHAMDRRLVAVFEILDVLLDVTGRVDREDVAVASVVVEWVTVHGIGWLLGRQEENSARLCVGIVCFCCTGCKSRAKRIEQNDIRWPPIG